MALLGISNFKLDKFRNIAFLAFSCMIAGGLFSFIMCISLDGQYIHEAHFPFLMMGSLCGFFISIGIALLELFYIKAKPRPLWYSFTVIPVIQSCIIAGIYGVVYSSFFGIELLLENTYGLHVFIFSFCLTFLVNFWESLERLLGKNVLKGLILGTYKRPRKEKRFVMFLDIAGSTGIAERIGDVKFHSFLNAFFTDIARPIIDHHGEIYKYVGDEVIITWKEKKGMKNSNVICVCSDIRRAIVKKTDWYNLEYGVVPEFRCGIHFGSVVMGEMGLSRQEIAFSGDVMNTTARIQSECRPRGVQVLVSKSALECLGPLQSVDFRIADQGEVSLRGKSTAVQMFSVEI